MSQAAGPSRTTKTGLNELWNDAIEKFHKSVSKSDLNSHETRALKDTIEELRKEASQAGSSFNSTSQDKFFSINSESFIQRLSVILEIGDKVMSAAPSEIASLVWMGVSLVGRIFVEGEKYTKRMEESTHKMIEVVLICEVYARRHVQGHVEDEFEDTTQSTHNLITELLSQVLEFFHIMTKHFESKDGRKGPRILTFTKAYFSTKCQKLLDISDEAMKTVNSLQRTATINFEAATLKLLHDVHLRPEKHRKLEQMTIGICKSIEIRFGKVQDDVSELSITRKSTAIGEKLRSWGIEDPEIQIRKYHEKIEQRYKNSCRWIFDQRSYQSWKSKERGILWLSGGGGVGKSTLMSTVVENFVKETKTQATTTAGDNPILLHFFCRLGNQNSEIAWRIMLYLCVQLFQKATDSISGNTPLDLRSECNDAAGEFIQEYFPSNLEMSTLHSFFAKLGAILNRPILIVVDALDECTEEDQLLGALERISTSKMKVRIIASSRNQPSLEIEHIQIDAPEQAAKTYADIKAFVSGSLKNFHEWNVEEAIISKAEGNFKYARIAIDSLINVPEGVFTDLEAFSRDLPDGINGLYQRKINDLSVGARRVLITALRWLVCGGDKIQFLPIADELRGTYNSTKTIRSGRQLTLQSRCSIEELEVKQIEQFAMSFKNVGRDFLRVNGTTLHLEHNSIRDFVNSFDRMKFQAGSLDEIASAMAEAGEREGHSLMAEHILKTLNSPGFQERFLSSMVVDKYKDAQRKATKADQLRYEIVNWQKHVREAEKYRARYESRWNTILCEAKRFLSSTKDSNNAYINWLKLKSTPNDDRSRDSPLHVAARYGIVSLMKTFVSDDLRNKSNSNGDIPLHIACSGHSDFVGVDLLLGLSNVNIRNNNGDTPLLLAIRNNAKLSLVKKLLGLRADPTLADNGKTTCLHLAAGSHIKPVCEALLEHRGVAVNALDKRCQTPLHFACKKSHAPKDLIEFLLEKGANPNAQDKDSVAPLSHACIAGNDQVVKLLLQKKADINDDDVWGNTALHGAIAAGNKSFVELLINWNAKELERMSNAGQSNDNGRENSRSPVHEEWMSQARDSAQRAKAINMFAKNIRLRDAVAHSACFKEFKIMEFLIDTHCQRRSDMRFLLETDKHGKIALHYCIESGEEDAVQKLLQAEKAHGKIHHNQQLNQKMCEIQAADGGKSLHMAAWRGQSSIVKILLAHGAQKDSLCSTFTRYIRYGKTPLDAAFGGWQEFGFTDVKLSQSFEDVIKSLFPHGIDLSEKSRKFVCALERNSKTIFDLLRPWNEYKDPYGWPCMLVAAEYGFRIPEGNATRYDNVPRNTSPPNRWGYGDRRLNISADGLIASCDPMDPSKKFHMSVRANNPVQPGTKLFYFEIEILQSDSEKPVIGVGFCSRLAPIIDVLPGSIYARALTWGYRGDNGKIYSWNHEEGRTFNARFGAGDVIGCGLNLTNSPGKRSIYYTKNGKLLGTAFRDVKGQLFPVLGIEGQSSKVAVRANFGNDAKRPFKYKHPSQS